MQLTQRPRPRILAVAIAGVGLVATTAFAGLAHAQAARPKHHVTLPAGRYLVGAATRDITPIGTINLGGYGLGDGSFFPQPVIGRGGRDKAQGEHIRSRAMVVGDGNEYVALADIETQGYFWKYNDGPWGIEDIAARVSKLRPDLRPDHILIASDHTHAGPDTIGAWGGVSNAYMQTITDQTVAAIVAAYDSRTLARLVGGTSDASDLVYNQACSEGLNQSKKPAYSGPPLCATPGKDGIVRVLQAQDLKGRTVVTFMAYAAHGTAGGGRGVNGDWGQYLSDAMAAKYGGVGLAMVGALGGTQPCRAACSFTSPKNPGYNLKDRKPAIVANYLAHVVASLKNATVIRGPVGGTQSFIREPILGPAVAGLFLAGSHTGTHLMRSTKSPYVVGQTIRTVASAMRIGSVLINGNPGEGFPAIGQGVRDNITGFTMEIQLGLANDQLGYLIAPVSYVPIIAAEVAVNDNIIFNVSPTIGDHSMCATIRLSLRLGFAGASPGACAPYDAVDATGDPIGALPVGGLTL